MALPDPQSVVDKWEANTSAAAGTWASNSESTPVDPTALAIQAIPSMRAGIISAIDSGRVANGLRKAGKTKWLAGINAAASSGKFAAGVTAGKDNALAGFTTLLADEARGQAQLPSDKSTAAARRARLISWADWMAGYKTRNP